MKTKSKLFRKKVNAPRSSSKLPFKRRKNMLNKKSAILSIFFILMLAATFVFADDQLNITQTGVAGGSITNQSFRGFILRLQWISASNTTQLKMTVGALPGPSTSDIRPQDSKVFLVNSKTRISINGRVAGPKELKIADPVTVEYGASTGGYLLASKVSVKRPTEQNLVTMNCKIEEIVLSGMNYIFVMESLGGTSTYYYDLIVTPDSKLIRNGKPAHPSEFQPHDVGTASFYMDNLKIVTFVALSPHN
jgi:hypothetical protein